MTYQLHHGDCLNIMPLIERESVDAVICDPPYGLSFMGKDWDHGVPGMHFWLEALRCAKPGAYLLAFGGTRTFHRLAVAIEDAGWEIRDTVMWVYGQGFPKSHDVSKAIDREAGAEREVIEGAYHHGGLPSGVDRKGDRNHALVGIETTHDRMQPMTAPATPAAAKWDGWGTALKPAFESIIVAQKPIDTDAERSIIVENLYTLEAQLWLLSLANVAEENLKSSQAVLNAALSIARWTADNWRSTQAALCDQMDISQFASMVYTILNTVSSWLNIWEEALKHGSMFITETVSSQIIDLKTLNSSVSALTLKSIIEAEITQPGSWLNVLPAARILSAVATKLIATLDLFAIENAINAGLMPSPDAIDPNVLNLPIIVARKPIVGTVAENVQRYGTGAMNIDACRIETAQDDKGGWRPNCYDKNYQYDNEGAFLADIANGKIAQRHPQGRWPANLIHDGSAEVLAGFPMTSISSGGGGFKKYGSQNRSNQGAVYSGESVGFNDTGSAARFFYCAKASKQDRDEGLEIDSQWLDSIELIGYNDSTYTISEVLLWEKQGRNQSTDSNGEASQARDIFEDMTPQQGDSDSPMSLSGNDTTGLSLTAIRYTTSTGTRETIELKTLNSLVHSNTSGSTEDVISRLMGLGLSLVESVVFQNLSKLITTSEKMVLARGVNSALLKTQRLISVKDALLERHAPNIHSTVKPTALMRYLCRLVTPPNGTILDPFMGSGSTGKAAMLEGFNFIGIDTEIEYVEIAARRIEHACEKIGIVVDHPMMFETKRETVDKPKQLILL